MNRNVSTQHLAVAAALALALFSLLLLGTAGTARALPGGVFVPDQLIVKLADGVDIGEITTDYGTRRVGKVPGENVYLLELVDRDSSLNEVLTAMRDEISNGSLSRLVYVELNFYTEAPESAGAPGAVGRHRAFPEDNAKPSPGDYSSAHYADSALNISNAHLANDGRGTVIAVLDTGAQLNHRALSWNFRDVARRDFVDDDNNPSEPQLARDLRLRKQEVVGHGTHVAGIVGLVAPRAKIMPLRVLDRRGYGNVFDIVQAIHFADSEGADVINLSLGTPKWSISLRESVEEAIDNGTTVVAAAGNDNSFLEPRYPAARGRIIPASPDDGLLAVTSVGCRRQKSDWANYGTWVDIAAPGERILSAYSNGRYAYWSGTSMATPFVAGQSALIRSEYSSLDPAGVEQRIRDTARSLVLTDPDHGALMGAGHTDIGASLGQSGSGGPDACSAS